MPVFAVPKDTIDLLVSAALVRRTEPDASTARELVKIADRLGQEIWEENHAALATDIERPAVSAPAYEWQPVLELSEGSISDAHLLQVERCRRFVLEQCRSREAGGATRVHDLLDRLGMATARRLHAWPLAAGPDGQPDYLGIEATVPQWRRMDWPPVAAHAGAEGWAVAIAHRPHPVSAPRARLLRSLRKLLGLVVITGTLLTAAAIAGGAIHLVTVFGFWHAVQIVVLLLILAVVVFAIVKFGADLFRE